MPAGNLCIIHQPSGEIIATGQKTVKQCEKSILEHMSMLADSTNTKEVTASYAVFTPYKSFGDRGIKAYSVNKTDLTRTPTPEPTMTQEAEEDTDTSEEREEVNLQEIVL